MHWLVNLRPKGTAVATTDLSPRVYVACLGCYNAGNLHGDWFDADECLPDAAVEYFTEGASNTAGETRCSKCNAEEFVVHDTEDFGPYNLGEVSLPEASKVGVFLLVHGVVGAIALSHAGGDMDQARRYVDEYAGSASSLSEWAEDLHEADLHNIPNILACYIDWERVADEYMMDGYFSVYYDGLYYIFRNC